MFSSIDEQGRYAYANQPRIALWNLTRFAECLLPLLADDQDKAIAEAQAALGEFPEQFDAAYQAGLRSKLGLFTAQDGDPALAQDLLDAMARNQADFTLTFRRLSDAALDAGEDRQVRALFADPAAYDEWAVRWRQRIGGEPQPAAERRTAMRVGQSRLHPAKSPGRSDHRGRGQSRRLCAVRGTAGGAGKAVWISRRWQPMPTRPSRTSGAATFCGT